VQKAATEETEQRIRKTAAAYPGGLFPVAGDGGTVSRGTDCC